MTSPLYHLGMIEGWLISAKAPKQIRDAVESLRETLSEDSIADMGANETYHEKTDVDAAIRKEADSSATEVPVPAATEPSDSTEPERDFEGWTLANKEKLLAMRERGLTFPEIAKEMGEGCKPHNAAQQYYASRKNGRTSRTAGKSESKPAAVTPAKKPAKGQPDYSTENVSNPRL